MALGTYLVGSAAVVGAPGEVHTTLKNKLGTVARDDQGNELIYLSGAASVVDGDWVTYQAGVFAASRLAAGAKGSVAIATAAVNATTSYGWFLIVGSDTAVCESSIVSNASVYAMATAGRVDDAIVKNDQVKRAKTLTAGVAGATATVAIDRPFIGSNDESV